MKKLSLHIKYGLIGAVIGFSLFILLILLGNWDFINGDWLNPIVDFFIILISPFFLLNLCEELMCIFFMPFFALIEGFIVGFIIGLIISKTKG